MGMFDDSTHGYLINYDDHRDVNNMMLAIFMYFIQMFLYSLLWSEAMALVKDDQVEVTIGFMSCSGSEGKPSIENLQCEAKVGQNGTTWSCLLCCCRFISSQTSSPLLASFSARSLALNDLWLSLYSPRVQWLYSLDYCGVFR